MSKFFGSARLQVVGTFLVGAVLTGCSLLPGQGPEAAPSELARPPVPASAPASAPPTGSTQPTASTTPTSTPAADPSVPPLDIPTFPTTEAPTPKAPDSGLRVRTTTIRGRSGSATWKITIPVFSGPPVAREVNRRVRAAANDLIRQVRREASGDGGTKRTLTGEGTVVTNDGRTAQVTIGYVDYLAGTARPASYVTTTVVDVRRARPVLLSQVVQNPPEGLRLFRTQVVKAAKKKGDPVERSGLAPKLANYANWQTTPDGVTFIFAEYQLGGAGLRSYTVPWSAARLVLSEYGEKLLLPR